jgi:hypothetical protein
LANFAFHHYQANQSLGHHPQRYLHLQFHLQDPMHYLNFLILAHRSLLRDCFHFRRQHSVDSPTPILHHHRRRYLTKLHWEAHQARRHYLTKLHWEDHQARRRYLTMLHWEVHQIHRRYPTTLH